MVTPTTAHPIIPLSLDRWHAHCLSIFTLVTDKQLSAGDEVTLIDSSGGTFAKVAEVVSVQPISLDNDKELPSVLAWHVCGTNSIRAMRQLRDRFPGKQQVTVVVLRVKENS